MKISFSTPVGEVAAARPASIRVFERHGIDYCCQGGRPLGEACETVGADLAQVGREITAAEAFSGEALPETLWANRPAAELVAHIIAVYHVPLRTELPRLRSLAEKVNSTHGGDTNEQVLEVFTALQAELFLHMDKEEQAAFPMVVGGGAGGAGDLFGTLEDEHEAAGAALAKLNALTDGYRPPAEACASWRALWQGLAALEPMMHRHIHLENNILFPQALKG